MADEMELSDEQRRVVDAVAIHLNRTINPMKEQIANLNDRTVSGFATLHAQHASMENSMEKNWQQTRENKSLIDRMEMRLEQLREDIATAKRRAASVIPDRVESIADTVRINLGPDNLKRLFFIGAVAVVGWATAVGVNLKELLGSVFK